jgi:hypothetical protein
MQPSSYKAPRFIRYPETDIAMIFGRLSCQLTARFRLPAYLRMNGSALINKAQAAAGPESDEGAWTILKVKRDVATA